MRKPICQFVSAFNQALKKKKTSFSFAYFRHFVPIMEALVSGGYVQYYTVNRPWVTVYPRMTPEGPLLKQLILKSTPGYKRYIRWRDARSGGVCQLTLVGAEVLTGTQVRKRRRGGILLLEVR